MSQAVPTRPLAVVLHDDLVMATHVHGLLVAAGYHVELAGSALELLAPRTLGAHLMILGAASVDDRDRELVPILRERSPGATIVVLFPSSLRERAAAMLERGADASLPEPFYPGELSALARRALQAIPPVAAVAEAVPVADPAAGASEAPAAKEPTSGATPVQQVAVGVAHAVRNPLQIMELMIASAEAGDELDLDALRGLMTRIAGVVSDLSRFGDHVRVPPRGVALAPAISEVFDAVPDDAAPGLEVSQVDASIAVWGEPELLRSALEILRDRALRDTPRDGRIDVRVAVRGQEVHIAVSDGGPAPSVERLPHFFEPDWDMDVVQAGTWLEMAAFAGMVRSQGGDVTVAPAGETGTTVTIRLPVFEDGSDAG